MSLVYSHHYNMGLYGLEKLHPFDTKKFERAWNLLRHDFGKALTALHVDVDRPVTDEELLTVHSAAHLERMHDPKALAKAFEVPQVELLPISLIEHGFLTPMKWATRGSVIAARQALLKGCCINLGGGFHHAKPDRAEGFCLFSDIALIVSQLRAEGLLQPDARVAYIDLDAHQGNGVCHQFLQDPRTFIFDMFNGDIYPTSDRIAQDRIDCKVPLPSGCGGQDYLHRLKKQLPPFLNSITTSGVVALAIYVAGTDVFAGDDLGMMSLTAEDVLERDLFVVEELRQKGLATVMLLGGGYTSESHRLVANSVKAILQNYCSA